MADVFISYARDDEAVARRVAKALQGSGLQVWWDANLPAHRAYSEEIERNLEAAKAVVVLWSASAAKSQWVRAEADFARNAGKLVQAQLDGTLPPMPFNQIQCADLQGWRGNPRNRSWAKLKDSIEAVLRGEKPAETPSAGVKRKSLPLWAVAIGAFALLALAALLAPRFLSERPGQPRIAVTPFVAMAGSDKALVEGIWEDTRQALARNPQLLVLGPNTSEQIARQSSGAARKAADYLVAGSVRTAANRVRISASLTRTRDGTQVWSQTFDRELDDVFSLQSQIAQEIEGRIRGRLARGGGTRPEQIATSGEVYALYNSARAVLLDDNSENFVTAHRQLQDAVRMDPNFAPAWAALALAEWAAAANVAGSASTGKESETYARRAIALAPNLAAGHAALAFALGQGPVAEASLRRAVALDPNDVETLTWLASVEYARGNSKRAMELYDRALQIEPLWWQAVLSRLEVWFDSGDDAALDRELARVDRLGDPKLSTFAHMAVSEWRGDLSAAAKVGLALYRRTDPSDRGAVDDWLASLLLRLGHDDVAWQLSNAPPAAQYMWRSDPRGLAMFESRGIPPTVLWKIAPTAEVVSRTYVTMGREAKVAQMYRAAAASPDEFLTLVEGPRRYLQLAPTIAVALRRTGDDAAAQRLIAVAETVLARPARNRMNLREQAIYTARVRAVEGRNEEAVAALREAVEHGWWPAAPYFKPDLQDDPPLGLLRAMPEFQKIRAHVLAHLAKERAELGPIQLGEVKMAAR